MSELNKQNVNVKSLNKIVRKFFAKLLKYMKMFMEILTFLGLDEREDLFLIWYYVVLGISI